MRSAIRLLDPAGRPLDAFADTEVLASSRALGWEGLTVESGRNAGWEAIALTPDRHYLALNTGRAPLRWQASINDRMQGVANAPGEVWFCPAGEAFTHVVQDPAEFVLVTIDPVKFADWTGARPFALDRRYGLAVPQLDHLTRALAEEAARGGPNGRLFVDAIGAAMSLALGQALGVRPAPAPGALAPARLTRVLDYIDAHLGAELSVDVLARVAHYSPAHFARAFNAAVGEAPHRYVLSRRLERARTRLEAGAPLAAIATELGFTDQSHFGKAFAKRFGTPPGRYVRGHQR